MKPVSYTHLNKWLDSERIYEGRGGYAKGAFIDRDSPYHNFFMFHDENRFPSVSYTHLEASDCGVYKRNGPD